MTDFAPGWDAIDVALVRLYGNQVPAHYGPEKTASMGGQDPLDGISVYKTADHWHYVGYGLSELYMKYSEDPHVSGLGFELTFRLARSPREREAPEWPLHFLQDLARYVLDSGASLQAGNYFRCQGPIDPELDTAIQAIALVLDPQLLEIDTPHGRVRFLQIVGLTADEEDVIANWDFTGLITALAEGNPMLVTDLKRTSIFADPDRGPQVKAEVEKDGSSTEVLLVDTLQWKTAGDTRRAVEIIVDADAIHRITRLLKGRTLHGRPFSLMSQEAIVEVRPATRSGWKAAEGDEGEMLKLELTRPVAESMLASLEPQRGTYQWPAFKDLTVHVVPCEIKDREGNVVQIIG